jgi:uncharacterized membrane protein YedE/YeeE
VAAAAAFFYDPSPQFGANPTPFVLMMVAGFVIGVAGHVMRSRSTVALGIGLIFLATFVLPLLLNIARASS